MPEPETSRTSVAGRWQRLDQPSEWMEFGADSSFRSKSFTGTRAEGRYHPRGDTVVVRIIPAGHGATLVLEDTLLVMEEGTRYRRLMP